MFFPESDSSNGILKSPASIKWRPELLSPAGSLEKCKVAILYGADAVYLSGKQFGLRQAADNLSKEELQEAVSFVHARKKKIYITINSFFFDEDFDQLGPFIRELDELKVDAVIVSDMGVAAYIRKHSSIPLHISTQATILTIAAAKIWKKIGASRVIVGRELSIAETGKIKKQTGLEVEMFIHGSMCSAYSGHCVISNFTQGRDSNRGGCAHSCRFDYSFSSRNSCGPSQEQLQSINKNFMSSKDLNGLHLLEQFFEHKIDSLKIEGRMKSELYAATTSSIYAKAMGYILENSHLPKKEDPLWLNWQEQLESVSRREYTEASLISPATIESIYEERSELKNEKNEMTAFVLEASEKLGILLDVRRKFSSFDELGFLNDQGKLISVFPKLMKDLGGNPMETTKPSSVVRLPFQEGISKYQLVKKIR